MRKQMVYWKAIRTRNKFGGTFLNPYFPSLINQAYRGELLFRILSMEPKIPISYEQAMGLVEQEYRRKMDAGQFGYEPGQSYWYYGNFVEWLSNQGYHVELTGDEFETPSVCKVVA